jgi:PAS domain S-box-containing protein
MSYQAFTGLIGNASLLLALGLMYDFVSDNDVFKGKSAPYVTGFLVGLLGIVVMMNPWRMSSDVVFDTRSILLSLTGLFFGFIPSLVAAVMTSIYRIYNSGLGVYAGIATIISSSAIGLLWRYTAKKRLSSVSMSELYFFGIVVHIGMLFCMLLLPVEARSVFYSGISVPVMIIYPIASMLLGKLLSRQLERADQKRMIKKEKELLSVTLRSIGDAVVATDTEGKVIMINKVAEELTGWSYDLAKGKNLCDILNLINETTGEKCECPVEKVLTSGKISELANHTVLISRNGKRYIIEDSAAPINDETGNTVGVVLVFRDMTEKNRMSEKMRNTEKLESLGILAGGIAHDFNNLLSGIYGNIELAMAKNSSDDVEKYLTKATGVFERAKELTKQLLTFSKGGTPNLKPGDLLPVIKKSTVFALSGSKSSCEFDLPDDLWKGCFDSSQISDVLHNLVLNASQAMPEGGKIAVSAKNIYIDNVSAHKIKQGRYVKISVKDKGTGINRDDMSKIFDPFFTTKERGTGLGLPTAFSILQKHNGTIDVESVPGSGSVFSIFIPSADSTEKEPCLSVSDSSFNGIGKKVLVMDDEIYVRDVLGSMLEQLGFNIDKACDGSEAVMKIATSNEKNEKYFAVFFDLTVQGGMGGEKAVNKIREFDKETPVFAASGYSDGEIIVSPEKFGFNGSIRKPFNLTDLVKVLKKVSAEQK